MKIYRFIGFFLLLSMSVNAADSEPLIGTDHIIKADPQQEEQRQLWIGHWAGEAPAEKDSIYRWLLILEANGTFFLHGRVYQKGAGVTEGIEIGDWVTVDGYYITRVTDAWDGEKFVPVDSYRPNFWSIHRIINMQKDEITYYHEGLKKTYKAKRVAEEYKLPEKG